MCVCPERLDLVARRKVVSAAIVKSCRRWLLRRKTGGRLRGAQVRPGCAWKPKPESSTKTINAWRRLAFFDPGPMFLEPLR
jgi:hypothetical protein